MKVKNLYPNMPDVERKKRLQGESDKIDKFKYSRLLTEEEKTDLKNVLSDQTIDLDNKQTIFDELAYEFRQERKKIKKSIKKAVSELRNNCRVEEEICYFQHDQNDRKTYIYNGLGELVAENPLAPEDRQLNILTVKEGSND